MMKKTWIWTAILLTFLSFSAFGAKEIQIKTGPWRFELRTANAVVPFIVELVYAKKDRLQGKIYNGKEKIPLNDIIYRNNQLSIPIKNYEITMELKVDKPHLMSGSLVRHNKNPKSKTSIVATHGHKTRYSGSKLKPSVDISGRWLFEITETDGKKAPAVGIFTQNKNYVTGSILTLTGDYRFMEGYVSDNNFELASFDGVYNYVFRGTVVKDKLQASILSNSAIHVLGQKDPKAVLPSPYNQTSINKLVFMFPDLKGNHVNLNHPKFKDKPVIVQIFGSWCPNCLDEMEFLIPWYNENNKQGIEVIALAFERSLSVIEAKRQLIKTKRKLDVPYTILHAGSTAEDKPADLIKGLENFISFPTTIFLNRKHEVVKVHAGFSGPGTGEFFEKWKEEFDDIVGELLKK